MELITTMEVTTKRKKSCLKQCIICQEKISFQGKPSASRLKKG